MYVIIDNDPALQLSISHKEYPKWVKGVIAKMKKNGAEVYIIEAEYVSFITEDDLIQYNVVDS